MCGKKTIAPFIGVCQRDLDLLGLIHIDSCGPFMTITRSSEKYFITFTDDFHRFRYMNLMKHKHEALDVLLVFQNEVHNQLGKKIKSI